MYNETNELIAQFLDWEKVEGSYITPFYQYYKATDTQMYETCKFRELLFHKDWNWLMQVVEKIESLGINKVMNINIYSRFEIKHNHIQLNWSKDNKYQLRIEIIQDWQKGYKGSYKEYKRININKNTSKIQAIYNACIEFIKWYNEQNK